MQAVVENLQSTLGKMEIALGSISEAIVFTDSQGNIQWCNKAFDLLLGKTHLTVLGKNLVDLLPLELDDKQIPEEDHPLQRLKQGKKIVRSAYSFKGTDGWVWIDISGNLIDLAEAELLIFFIQDVSELIVSKNQLQEANLLLESRIQERTERLQEVSNRYQAILDCAVDAIITIDHQGTILSLNPAMEKMFGYSTIELLGRNINIIMPEPHHSKHNGYLKQYLVTGDSRIIGIGREIKGVRSTGQSFPLHLSVSRVDLENQVLFTGILRDISKQTEMIAELEATRGEAIEASRAKSDFLAKMSHELRTPLNAILGMADLLLESELTEEQRKYATVSRGSGGHLLNIIDDLLDISRIEAGKLALEESVIDLGQLVEVVVAIGRSGAEKKDLSVEAALADDVPPCVLGDPIRLRQILINLVGNSVKFTDKGHIQIDINLEQRDNAAGFIHLKFVVSDTGIGIAPEVQQTIFGSFAQADRLINRKYGGTGLGLAISKRLVTMMGGEIGVESTPGAGSTFSFTAKFGICQDETHTLLPQRITPPEVDEQPLQQFGHAPLKILLAEDSADNRLLFTAYLKSLNCTLDIAENGLEAVGKFKEKDYDVVLMDIQMPEMDGLSATNEIRQYETAGNLGTVPIIALTAHAQETDKQASLEAGCTTHVVKPVAKNTLLETITKFTNLGRENPVEPVKVFVDRDLEGLIPTFMENRKRDLAEIQQILEGADFERLRELGHMLKGVGGGYGFDFVTEIGSQLERCGSERELETAKTLVLRLSEMLGKVEITYTN